ncbi:unnamed protein product [Cyclocybe aegerita]|uniref:Exonuclease domain-containing protein n=1 Tax=Cyclocybe aegerita TaxID=1973307 RepID=A0A8S0VQ77_CYCAE|nr:unnamed protein product [Cyclocybe aegerita]
MYKPLEFLDGPLVWIDCEMTGLDPRKDRILEIAVLITNGNLETVDPGIEYVIKTEKAVLDGMNPWCIDQHGKSGLTQACIESPHTPAFVSQEVLNSVHADQGFLAAEMPELIKWLHYRIVDVSSIKEMSRRWYGDKGIPPRSKESSHRALDDIRCSIQELQWYRENIFIQPSALPKAPRSLPSTPTE